MSTQEVSLILSSLSYVAPEELTLRLNLNQLHPRVLRPTSMHAILQITKPRRGALAPHLLDTRVGVRSRDGFAGDRDPILVARVVEGDVGLFGALLEVVELLAVCVGEEEEVGPCALGDGHGAADGL